MKKLFPTLLAVCLLAGCGGPAAPSYDVEKTPAALLDAGVFVDELEELDLDIACFLYEIDPDELTAGAAFATAGISAEEVAVFQFKTAALAEAAFPLLEARRAAQQALHASYAPLAMPRLEHAVLDRRGDTLLYLVADDIDAAKAILDGK